ncbi:hypothetical protein [Priestia megaterium]|uniref:hypothetical protein n=1 Tax=Priestia megaterium TaxID=1404 RepID=UPI0004727C80|nr:hypothetical protein [Priestia megaterium]MEC1071345.1 hypothetical protein [Priestia megaterium]
MSKIKVKKHLLVCTCILGLSTVGVLIQSSNESQLFESSDIALNSDNDTTTHITAEEQKEAELHSMHTTNKQREGIVRDIESLTQESGNTVEVSLSAEDQKQIEQAQIFNDKGKFE